MGYWEEYKLAAMLCTHLPILCIETNGLTLSFPCHHSSAGKASLVRTSFRNVEDYLWDNS